MEHEGFNAGLNSRNGVVSGTDSGAFSASGSAPPVTLAARGRRGRPQPLIAFLEGLVQTEAVFGVVDRNTGGPQVDACRQVGFLGGRL